MAPSPAAVILQLRIVLLQGVMTASIDADSNGGKRIMHRREFVTAVGAAAAVVSAAQAFANPASAAAAESMHPAKYKALEESTAHCVATGEACMRHCLACSL